LILVDTSVLIDVLADDAIWRDRSLGALELAGANDRVAINDIIYAELAPGYDDMEMLDRALAPLGVSHVAMPKFGLFLAGQAVQAYRRRGGPRSTILPDFLIGAHALAEEAAILTRDPDRIARHFPTVPLISP
jgi:predicted nucleic acid-binding protein